MMKKQVREIVLWALVLVSLAIGVNNWLSKPRIGYVKTRELLSGYQGMKEAGERFKAKQSKWENSADTLKQTLGLAVENYKADSGRYTRKEKIAKREHIRALQYKYYQLQKNIEELANEEDEKLTLEIMNQVNAFIEQYGEKHGYDIIFGTLETGNILYGTKGKDITRNVLSALNDHYEGN